MIAVADRIANKLGSAGYDNIGTVEMLMGSDETFSFLEMNTRLQVEHGVTEEITGTDLVAAKIRASAGDAISRIFQDTLTLNGHSIEARVDAEDPTRLLPSPGSLAVFREHPPVRVPPQN